MFPSGEHTHIGSAAKYDSFWPAYLTSEMSSMQSV
jgi:hypothetical protein